MQNWYKKLFDSWGLNLVMRNSLFHESDNTWVLIVFTIEMLCKSDNQQYETDEIDNWQEYKANEDKYQNCRNTRIEYKADIKVNNLIADFSFLRREFIFTYKHVYKYENQSERSSWDDIADEV